MFAVSRGGRVTFRLMFESPQALDVVIGPVGANPESGERTFLGVTGKGREKFDGGTALPNSGNICFSSVGGNHMDAQPSHFRRKIVPWPPVTCQTTRLLNECMYGLEGMLENLRESREEPT